MRFVKVTSVAEPSPSNILDPEPYLCKLPELQDQLPAGARAFATDPDHYDFASVRCVKDLRFEHLLMRESGNAELGIEIALAPNQFKHSTGLVIRYEGVVSFAVDVDPIPESRRIWPDSRRLGDLQLDEVLPHESGCTHEVKMTGGIVIVICRDLIAEWGFE
jgi:hypothetical protein